MPALSYLLKLISVFNAVMPLQIMLDLILTHTRGQTVGNVKMAKFRTRVDRAPRYNIPHPCPNLSMKQYFIEINKRF